MAPIVLNNFYLNNFFVFGLSTEIFRCVKMGHDIYRTNIKNFFHVFLREEPTVIAHFRVPSLVFFF